MNRLRFTNWYPTTLALSRNKTVHCTLSVKRIFVQSVYDESFGQWSDSVHISVFALRLDSHYKCSLTILENKTTVIVTTFSSAWGLAVMGLEFILNVLSWHWRVLTFTPFCKLAIHYNVKMNRNNLGLSCAKLSSS